MMQFTVRGLPDVRAELAALAPKLRKRAIRNALAAGGRVVRAAMRQVAPVLSASDPAVAAGRRAPGTLRKALSVRTSKAARRRGDVGVFVNVRPAKKGQRGAKSPGDPFYWRWVNFGWNPGNASGGRLAKRQRRAANRAGSAKRKAGARFLEAGARQLQAALSVIMPQLQAAIAKLNRPKAPAP